MTRMLPVLFCLFLICDSSRGQTTIRNGDDIKIEGMIDATTDRVITQGLEWLADRHNGDGSFGEDRLLQGNTGVCGLAGIAFLSEGSTTTRGKYSANIRRCISFLKSHSNIDTGLIDNPDFQSSGPMYGHGFATLFLAEVYGMSHTSELRDIIQNAVQMIVETQNELGGWRYQPNQKESDLSVTVCQIMALRSARNAGFEVPASTIEKAVAYILESQNDDGGFCYQLDGPRESGFARSAAAIVGLQSAGVYSDESITKGMKYLFESRPSPDRRQGTYYHYGHYYAVLAAFQVGGNAWDTWYPAIRNEMNLQQQADGGWDSRYSREYATAMSLIILQLPNNLLPIFQR